MHKAVLALSTLTLLCLYSCKKQAFFHKTYLTDGFWHKDSIVDFSFQSPDTIDLYNFFIHIRNTQDYSFSNLFLITSIKFPHGKIVVDTLEYKMASQDGKLLGEGFGSLKYNKLWYKEALRFTEKGEYNLKIRHAMRKPNQVKGISKLKGIKEIGFSFEPLNFNNNE